MTDRKPVADTAAAGIRRWPALGGCWPSRLQLGRAVWGKAHGSSSDFRWLAASPDLDPSAADLGRMLNLGPEDRPDRFVAWRRLERDAVAVGGYPSRAVDAAGRRGFLEKGVLAAALDGETPSALAALLLLPLVAELDDELWWSRRSDPAWRDRAFVLALEPSPALEVEPERLSAAIGAGIAELKDAVTEGALAELYASLLAGALPATLGPLGRPLSPRALAALLLPLPRSAADRISLAGWLPSSRGELRELGRRWDVVVLPNGFAVDPPEPPPASAVADGERLARALWSDDPELLAAPAATGQPGIDRTEPETAVAGSWGEWTAAMYADLTATTDRLIACGLWEVWRQQADLEPLERARCAVAWLGARAWSRSEAAPPSIELWEAVLEDAGVLDERRMKALCVGPQGRHGWPWIPAHEERQLAALCRHVRGLEAVDLLRHSLEPEKLDLFDGLAAAIHETQVAGSTTTSPGAETPPSLRERRRHRPLAVLRRWLRRLRWRRR